MTARVLFVTGKGGTGKSGVASALAHEAARQGLRVLLLGMAGASAAKAAGTAASTRDLHGGRLVEKTLDGKRDLEAFLTRVLGLGLLARRLGQSRTFSAVAAAAPGVADLVAFSSIAAEAGRRRDLVVVDAPASGHSVPLLTAAARVLELAPVGPVAREARRALAMVGDRRAFAALLVTTPEELAVSEVLTLRDDVRKAGVACVHVVVNGVWPAYVSEADGERLAAAAVSSDATTHWRRHRRQADLVTALEARVGACTRLGFSFRSGRPPAADIGALLELLEGEAA
ncbi:MAG: ArsA-related P-loop ATPase [Candidatus Binatia bacterium]